MNQSAWNELIQRMPPKSRTYDSWWNEIWEDYSYLSTTGCCYSFMIFIFNVPWEFFSWSRNPSLPSLPNSSQYLPEGKGRERKGIFLMLPARFLQGNSMESCSHSHCFFADLWPFCFCSFLKEGLSGNMFEMMTQEAWVGTIFPEKDNSSTSASNAVKLPHKASLVCISTAILLWK